jgi:ABC-2 type transport system permease protein
MRIRAIIVKEFLHIRRDIRVLYFSLIWPVLLLVLFGYTVTFDVKNLPIAFYDQAGQRESRDLYQAFRQTGVFDIRLRADFSWSKSPGLLDRGEVRGLVVVPADLGRRLSRWEPAEIQVLVDGSDNNTARIMLGYVAGISQDFYLKRLADNLRSLGVPESSLRPPVDYRMRFLYNPSLRSQNFIVPGLIAVIMMILGTLLTALTITVEWERGTMEQLFYTPIRAREFILGKLTPYFMISVVQMTLILVTGIFIFKVPFRGSLPLFYLGAALFMLGALGVGLFLSLISRSQQVAAMLAFLTSFLPAFLLSGFIFPVANMPLVMRWLSYLVPARYFLDIARGLFLKGAGLDLLWPDFLIMTIYALFFIFISTRRFQKRIA